MLRWSCLVLLSSLVTTQLASAQASDTRSEMTLASPAAPPAGVARLALATEAVPGTSPYPPPLTLAPAPGGSTSLAAPAYAPGPRYLLDPRAEELRMLRSERPSLFWPIGTIALSGAAAVGIPLLISVAWMAQGLLGYGGPSHDDLRELRPAFIGAGVAAIVAGASVGWLVHNIRERRPYNLRIRELTTAPRAPALIRW